jgi:hypothetical protein
VKRALCAAFGAAAALLTWLAPRTAQAAPHHEGFTGDLGLGFAVEVIPGFYEDEVITGGAVVGAWKWY